MSEAKPDCEICGQPYHRYSPDDPEHEYSAVACINSLRGRIEKLEAERHALRVALFGARAFCGDRRRAEIDAVLGTESWA